MTNTYSASISQASQQNKQLLNVIELLIDKESSFNRLVAGNISNRVIPRI